MARYDSRTTTFSPDGRLFQVEYAMKAIQNAGACIGIKTGEAIVLATEKKDTSKLLAKPKGSEKIYKIDEHVVCAVAGLTSDANVLINYLRRAAQNYRLSYQEPQPIEQLLRLVCDLKQGYTQFGGQRPFGVSFLYAGYDDVNGLQLYHSDPSGNYSGWSAVAIGRGEVEGTQTLKEEFEEAKGKVNLEQAKLLGMKCFRKILDNAVDAHKKIELVVITKNETKGCIEQQVIPEGEIEKLLKVVDDEEKAKAAT